MILSKLENSNLVLILLFGSPILSAEIYMSFVVDRRIRLLGQTNHKGEESMSVICKHSRFIGNILNLQITL